MLDDSRRPARDVQRGFNFACQEHASNGYIVLYTNPRGRTGYGSAFGNAIKNAYPGKDYNDLMKGVDRSIGRGYVDTNATCSSTAAPAAACSPRGPSGTRIDLRPRRRIARSSTG